MGSTALTVLLTISGALITTAGWGLRSWLTSNKKMHQDHYDHAADRTVHTTKDERDQLVVMVDNNLKAHEGLDATRFAQVVDTLNEVRDDVKSILSRRVPRRRSK